MQYRSAALKVMSVINQLLLKYKTDEGDFPQCGYTENRDRKTRDCSYLSDYFLKNLNISKYCSSNAFQNGCIPDYQGLEATRGEDNVSSGCLGFSTSYIKNTNSAFITNDGFIFIPYSVNCPLFIVDLNGFKGPNKWGHDIHTFEIRYNESNMTSQFVPALGGCTQVEANGKKTTDLIYK